MRKKDIISERKIAKQFLENIMSTNKTCEVCFCINCECMPANTTPNSSREISKEELFNHFDLDNDGIVTKDEYVDHINYHKSVDPEGDFKELDANIQDSESYSISLDDNEKIKQEDKERACLLAIQSGYCLIRRENEIYAMYPDGNMTCISTSDRIDDVWRDALHSLRGIEKYYR